MLKSNIQDALNEQLNAEANSSYLYLSMAAFFQSKNFHGMARWMEFQAREEWGHAMRIYKHLIDRGGRVQLKQLDAPKAEWGSILDVFQQALSHECMITARIHNLLKLALTESDFATQSFLQWFVNEQVEEEANVTTIVERLKMMGDGNIGLVILDGELGKRAGD